MPRRTNGRVFEYINYTEPRENHYSRQSMTNDDVLVNNIRRQLGAYVRFALQEKMVSQASYISPRLSALPSCEGVLIH